MRFIGISTLILALTFTLVACDASPPKSTAAPVVMCGLPDSGSTWPVDACAMWTACVVDHDQSWAATYTAGVCGTDGRCAFTTPPTWVHCPASCLYEGPYGRCAHTGSTAP